MTDTEYLGAASPEVKEIDWYKLLERTDECEYNDADHSLAKLKQLTKNNPTEIGNSTDPDRESPSDNKPDRKRKFRSRGESKVIAPPAWLIQDLVQENTNVGIYAPSQFLKSFTAIDLAGALATGKPALGSLAVARSGPVFYAAGEGKANLEKKRVTAWEVANGLELYGAHNLYVGEGMIANDDETITADIGEINDILGGRSAVAIVIDTLALALNGLDEDKSHVAARYFHFLNRLRNETGASVTISIGHFGKDAERGERGSSAFQGSYDTILWIKKHHKDEDTGTHTIQLWVRKQKDGEDGANYYLQSKPVQTPLATAWYWCRLTKAMPAIYCKANDS